jgi:acetolactate synthase-1/2/3 large subunit
MKASDLFVKALENEGVDCIYGIPGEENLDLLESIRKSNIRLVLTRHESAAGFMAATSGRLTGKAGVCLSTLGPGATNLVTPAAYANLGGMPMLMITGQKPVKKSKQGQFQIVDVVEMMRPIVKYTWQIINADSIPSRVREAFRVAQEERPGAAHIELPEDIASEETDAELFIPSYARRPQAAEKALLKAVEMIEGAKCPFILIGAGANRYRVSAGLNEFIDHTEIPYFNTQLGKGVVDERHPLFIGTAALSDHDYLHCAIGKADLIINVGHDVLEKPPFFMERDGKNVIHINYFSARVDDVYFPQVEIIGDIASSIYQMSEMISPSSHWQCKTILPIKAEMDEHFRQKCEIATFPIIPQRVVRDVRMAMPDDGIIALDNGVYKIWFARNYPAYEQNTLLLDNALGTMGAGLPSAIAAKIIHPEREVMAICGDGGFMMNSQEIETAVRLKLDLMVIILRDDAYGMIKWKQAGLGFENFGLDFGNPDFVRYAESYGASGHKITNSEELLPRLKEFIAMPGVKIVEVPVDYSENERVLIEELKARTCNL